MALSAASASAPVANSGSQSHSANEQTGAMGTNVQVAVRCRPLNDREKAAGRPTIVQSKANTNEIAVVKRKTYTFDKVYGQYSTQKDVFRASVKPAVDEALAGYNCTVFAYGQTGTGKTHTMQGELSPDHEMAGIIPRSVKYIFNALQKQEQEYSVKVSFLQLYNEELKDLLAPDANKKLRLVEDIKRGGIYCQNLLEVTTTTASHVYELLSTGVKNRVTFETLMNENSSRSHSIFTIRIHIKENNTNSGEDLLKIGQLNLVDLAGSECIGRSGARNARAREAGSINQSLLTLGRVITALVDNHPHIPYRDSKLTRLLQESLGGRAKTTIIATLAPCAECIDETLSTLEYAYRAKSIKNKPEMNQKMTRTGLLKEYGSEIESLRNALQAARTRDGIYLPPEQFAEMEDRIAGQGAQIVELEDALENQKVTTKELEAAAEQREIKVTTLTAANQQLEETLAMKEQELASTQATLKETTIELEATRTRLSAYQANEQVLIANGAKATKLFNESEARAQVLLEKIEQSRRVEQENATLSNAYSKKTKSQLSAFQTRLQAHQDQQEALFSDVSSSIEQLQTVHSAGLSELVQCMNDMNSLLEDQKAKVEEECTKEQVIQSEQKSELQELLVRQQEAMHEQLQQFTKLTQRHAEAMSEEASRSKSKATESLESVKSKLADSRASVSSFITEQTSTMAELQTNIDQSIQEQMKQLQAHNESLVSALQASHAQHQKELDSVKTQMNQFVDACMASQVEKLREQTGMIVSNALVQQKQLGRVIKVTKQGVNSSTNAIKDLDGAHQAASTELQEMVDATGLQIKASNDRHIELVASHTSECKQWKKEIETAESTHATTMTTVLDKHEQSTQEWSIIKKDSTAKFMNSHHELGGKLSSGAASVETSFTSNVGGTKRKLGVASELAQQVLQESTSESSTQKEELTSFIKNRKATEPSGSTPRKKLPDFPTFEATSLVPKAADTPSGKRKGLPPTSMVTPKKYRSS